MFTFASSPLEVSKASYSKNNYTTELCKNCCVPICITSMLNNVWAYNYTIPDVVEWKQGGKSSCCVIFSGWCILAQSFTQQ